MIARAVDLPAGEMGYLAGTRFAHDEVLRSAVYIVMSWTFVGCVRGCYSFSSLQHRGVTRFLYCFSATCITKVIVVLRH